MTTHKSILQHGREAGEKMKYGRLLTPEERAEVERLGTEAAKNRPPPRNDIRPGPPVPHRPLPAAIMRDYLPRPIPKPQKNDEAE